MIFAFLSWWGVTNLIAPGTVPVDRVFILILGSALVAGIAMAIVARATGQITTRWVWLLPAIALMLLLLIAIASSGWEWLSAIPLLIFFAPPFALWMLLWRIATHLIVRRADTQP